MVMPQGATANHQLMGYDRSSTMFSPDGRLLQVEYAKKAVKQGTPSLGMVCKDGVFLLADRRILEKLMVGSSIEKVFQVDDHIAASATGFLMDGRVLIERAQLMAQQNRVTYDSPVDVLGLVKDIANFKQFFTQYGGARPFGVSLMTAGVNGKKSELFTSDVTGNYFSYYANAIGEDDGKIREKLREKYKHGMKIKEGVKLALEIFKEIKGNKFDLKKFELAYISNEIKKLTRLEGEEIKEL